MVDGSINLGKSWMPPPPVAIFVDKPFQWLGLDSQKGPHRLELYEGTSARSNGTHYCNLAFLRDTSILETGRRSSLTRTGCS